MPKVEPSSIVPREANTPSRPRAAGRALWISVLAGAGALTLTGTGPAHAATRARAAGQTTLTSYNGQRGRQLVVEMNGQKLTLYNFSSDRGKSTCYGTCAKTWRPLVALGKVVATKGSQINTRQLATVRRRDGSAQVTYYGQPLYRYRRDTKTGQMKGVDKYQFGGSWGVIGTNGGVLGKTGY